MFQVNGKPNLFAVFIVFENSSENSLLNIVNAFLLCGRLNWIFILKESMHVGENQFLINQNDLDIHEMFYLFYSIRLD